MEDKIKLELYPLTIIKDRYDNPLSDYEMFHRQQLAMTDMIVKSAQNCNLDKGGSDD